MIVKTKPLLFHFNAQPWGRKVDAVARDWQGTRYVEAGRSRRGIDCVNFGCEILDRLYGYSREKDLNTVRGDTCLHNKRGVIRAMRAILRNYPKHERVLDSSLEPGDIIVTGPRHGGPGHMMVAGGLPGILWHCTSATGVCQAGYSLPTGHKLFAVYRATDRSAWHAR